MPPKRKQPAAAAAPKQPAKRRSKLAKENDITADQEAEIQEAFAIFAHPDEDNESKEGVIAANELRRCLIALNAPPQDQDTLNEYLDIADPDEAGVITYEHFLPIAAIALNSRDDDPDALNEEVTKAYGLFTKGEDRQITLHDLRRVTKELREDVPDNILKDMIREATAGALGGVSMEDFESVMRRAGVFG
ncbi:Caltractin [Fulvia fulva]|uniref:Calmodulin n=1 Tax=Passalora fulva TaxID=5499 RepID=A0A9Q8L9T5_PASFU|nr:Caltractin [Fulvia fulva]KAK4631337.1 Caltractin [Fulvia fulva]KAK4632767.1 Caltractin [Fulvia fulva]UJO13406.1 Caltractin [Fulvia fulva]WPV11907.1 Caltractin [Fulvia fulva]WPV25695.1 Caltractin [Fulvia fulva]